MQYPKAACTRDEVISRNRDVTSCGRWKRSLSELIYGYPEDSLNAPLIFFKALWSRSEEYSTAFWKFLFSFGVIIHLLVLFLPPPHAPSTAKGMIAPLNLHASGIDRSKASKSHYTRLYCYCIDKNTLSEQLTLSHNYAEIIVAV